MSREHRLLFPALERLDEGPQRLDERAHRYLVGVLRLSQGSAITLFDGEGRCRPARLEEGEQGWTLHPEGEITAGQSSAPVSIAFALPKGEKVDLVARQLTELGVERLYLWSAARSVTRWRAEKLKGQRARLERVIGEAARQCGRADQLQLEGPLSLKELLALGENYPSRLFLEPNAVRPWPDTLAAPALLLIGPEGGLSEREICALTEAGWTGARWSTPILRTETAAVVAATLALEATGALRGVLL